MADFGIMLCSENEENLKERSITSFTNRFKKVFKAKKIELRLNQIELYKNFNMFVIKLQDSPESLLNVSGKHLKGYQDSISDICTKNNIKHFIIPEFLPDSLITESCIKNKFSGEYLYISLIWNVINEVLVVYKKDIEEIEVAIISGNNESKLNAVINLLLSKIKYLTIIAENNDSIFENANRIYQDTGLAIRVTSNAKNVFKDMDLIINLNNFYEFKSCYKLKSKAIIINYSDTLINWVTVENIIINKINIGIPNILRNKIDMYLKDNFNNLVLSEIILSHKENIDDEVQKSLYNYEKLKIMEKNFNVDGYVIDGFLGRRGFLQKIV